MKYKGYEAHVEFDDEAGVMHGQVAGLRDMITFEADCVADLEKAFHDSVDDYLEFCAQQGQKPEKTLSGNLPLRMEPALHTKISIRAEMENKSVNQWIVERLEGALEKTQ